LIFNPIFSEQTPPPPGTRISKDDAFFQSFKSPLTHPFPSYCNTQRRKA
jgi:hypothetical protein